MPVRAGKFAPIAAVAGVLGYLAWPYIDDPAAMRKGKDGPKPPELTETMLSPPAPGPLERNPFAAPGAEKGAPAAATPAERPIREGGIGGTPVAKAGGIGGDGPKRGGIGDAPRPKPSGIGGDGPKRGGIGDRPRPGGIGEAGPKRGGIGGGPVARKGGIGDSSARRTASTLPSDPSAFVLSGTFLHGKRRTAVINGSVYEQGQQLTAGDSPTSVSIVRVELDRVMLDVDGKAIVLTYPDRLVKAADQREGPVPAVVERTSPQAPAEAAPPLPAATTGSVPVAEDATNVPGAEPSRDTAVPTTETTSDLSEGK